MDEIYVYYETNNYCAMVYNIGTEKYEEMDMTDVYKLPHRFYMFKGFEPTQNGLKQFAVEFIKWTKELDKVLKHEYLSFKSHEAVAIRYFEKLCQTKKNNILYTNFQNHDNIDEIEYQWIEACGNSGLLYVKEGEYENCHGYDFSAQFPSILASRYFRIPTKRGKMCTLKELPTKQIKLGFYRVKITSNDKRFQKIFQFNKKNCYTSISLIFALECKNKYGYEINIELMEQENNCYIYENDITGGDIIFGYWFETLNNIKKKYPKNKLIKNMLSSLWGRIAQKQRLFKTEQECENEEIDYRFNYNPNHKYFVANIEKNRKGQEVYELVETKKPYRYNIARIKPFLLSKSRELTGKVGRKYIDDIVRIHTDCICFNQNHDDVSFEADTLKLSLETKTTGHIIFKGVNQYHNLTTGHKTENYD